MRSTKLIQYLQHEFHPNQLFPSLMMGFVSSIIDAIYAVSFAALIFSGVLAPYASMGIGLALLAVVVSSVVVALMSSLRGMLTTLQEGPTAIVALLVSSIAAQHAAASNSELMSTVIMAIAITNGLTGLFCFACGALKLGNLPRFIPYPVIGGFLAGTGWLLVVGAMSLMTDLTLNAAQFTQLFQPHHLLQWAPGFCFAIVIVIALQRFNHTLLVPGLIAGATALFYLGLAVTDTSISEARTLGLLLEPFPTGGLWQSLPLLGLSTIDWQAIASQLGNILTVPIITVLAMLLKTTGIELAIRKDLDLNHELQATGVANLGVGLSGGLIIGFQSLSLTTLSYGRLGIKNRLVGLYKALFCLLLLFAGGALIALFPKPVLGGMLLYLGLDYLVEWLYNAWFKLPKLDYLLVVLILIVIGSVGFLEGVWVGLLAAIAIFVINYSQVNVTKHVRSGATYQSHAARSYQQRRLLQTEGEQIYILELQGFLFFGTATTLLNQIRQRFQHSERFTPRFVVLDFSVVTGLDSSAVLSFVKLQRVAEKQQFSLVFTQLKSEMQRQLQQGGCLQPDNPHCQIFSDLDHGVEWCENQILEAVPQRRRRSLPLALQLDELFINPGHVPIFMDCLSEINLEAGQVLFQAGNAADALYIIELGEVTVFLELEAGQTRRIQSLSAGNLVGEVDFFSGALHQTSAVADRPSTLYCLSQSALEQLQREQPEVASTFQTYVLRLVSDRLTNAYREASDLLK